MKLSNVEFLKGKRFFGDLIKSYYGSYNLTYDQLKSSFLSIFKNEKNENIKEYFVDYTTEQIDMLKELAKTAPEKFIQALENNNQSIYKRYQYYIDFKSAESGIFPEENIIISDGESITTMEDGKYLMSDFPVNMRAESYSKLEETSGSIKKPFEMVARNYSFIESNSENVRAVFNNYCNVILKSENTIYGENNNKLICASNNKIEMKSDNDIQIIDMNNIVMFSNNILNAGSDCKIKAKNDNKIDANSINNIDVLDNNNIECLYNNKITIGSNNIINCISSNEIEILSGSNNKITSKGKAVINTYSKGTLEVNLGVDSIINFYDMDVAFGEDIKKFKEIKITNSLAGVTLNFDGSKLINESINLEEYEEENLENSIIENEENLKRYMEVLDGENLKEHVIKRASKKDFGDNVSLYSDIKTDMVSGNFSSQKSDYNGKLEITQTAGNFSTQTANYARVKQTAGLNSLQICGNDSVQISGGNSTQRSGINCMIKSDNNSVISTITKSQILCKNKNTIEFYDENLLICNNDNKVEIKGSNNEIQCSTNNHIDVVASFNKIVASNTGNVIDLTNSMNYIILNKGGNIINSKFDKLINEVLIYNTTGFEENEINVQGNGIVTLKVFSLVDGEWTLTSFDRLSNGNFKIKGNFINDKIKGIDSVYSQLGIDSLDDINHYVPQNKDNNLINFFS